MPARDASRALTGAEYLKALTARESDRNARQAFQALALRIAPAGGALFDFGAGTGMDARCYAEHGHSVAAFDVDSRMCEFFTSHCRDLIEAGRVSIDCGDYANFIAAGSLGDLQNIDLVTSNFAPLNLIDNLQELFARFHELTGPRGRVLASVLSPYYAGDFKYGWWWRNLPRLCFDGHFAVLGLQAPIVRRRLANFAAQSAPYFTLTRVFCGLPGSNPRAAAGVDVSEGVSAFVGLRLTRCRYMFLLFEKPGFTAGRDVE